MRTITLLLILLFPFSTIAQLTEDFSDGDFSANPTWSGDAANWAVVSGQLQVNGPAVTPTTTYLSLSSAYATNAQWEFFANPKCATSSGNTGPAGDYPGPCFRLVSSCTTSSEMGTRLIWR